MGSKWPETLLEELADEVTVGFVGSMASEYVEDGIPFFRSKNISPYRLNWDDVKYVSREFHQKIKKSTLGPGDVVIVRTGKPGTACIIPDDIIEANCSDLVIVRPGPNLDKHFLVYYLNSAAAHHISSHLVGAVQQHFNVGAAKKLSMALPPLAEQKAIARILGTLDDKIELNRRMNATLEGMAQALFKSWFVDFDPVIDNAIKAGNPIPDELTDRAEVRRQALANGTANREAAKAFPAAFQETEAIGWIPEGWKEQALYDLANFVNGAAYKGSDFSNSPESLPVIKIAEIKAGITAQTKFTEINKGDKYKIGDGDILLSWSGNPDTSIDTFIWTDGSGYLNQHIFNVCLHDEAERYFVYYQLKYLRSTFAEIARDKQTTGLGHFTAGDMKRLKVLKPTAPMLELFNTAVSSIYLRGYENRLATKTLTKLRDTLLPKLIAGDLLIPVPERLAKETHS